MTGGSHSFPTIRVGLVSEAPLIKELLMTAMDVSHFHLGWAFGVKAHLSHNNALEPNVSLTIQIFGYLRMVSHLAYPRNILLHSKAWVIDLSGEEDGQMW